MAKIYNMSQKNRPQLRAVRLPLDDLRLNLTKEELGEGDRELSDGYQYESAAEFQARQEKAEAERSKNTDELMKDRDDSDGNA